MLVDWVTQAAKAIRSRWWPTTDDIRKIILKHQPLKPDTAYMEVPRCETCKYWQKDHSYEEPSGICLRQESYGKIWSDCGDYTIMTSGDFGCVQYEAKP